MKAPLAAVADFSMSPVLVAFLMTVTENDLHSPCPCRADIYAQVDQAIFLSQPTPLPLPQLASCATVSPLQELSNFELR